MRHAVKVVGRVDHGLRTREDSNIKLAAYLKSIEACRCNPEYRKRVTGKTNRFANDIRLAAELPLPETVADHSAGRAAARTIIRRVEHAPDDGLHAENIKKFAAHPEPIGIAG